MGRACMELWTNVHYVLKVIVVVLLVVVEFRVLDWSMNRYWRLIYVEGYYLSSLLYLVFILYGYTWFDSTVILEICMIIVTIFKLLISVIMFFHEYYDSAFKKQYENLIYRYDRERFIIFVSLTVVGIIILIVDLILNILKASGKRSGGSGGTRNRQRQQQQRQVEEEE